MNDQTKPAPVGPVQGMVGLRWQCGEPPKDGKYEMKRRVRNACGQYATVDWAEPGWWNGTMYVRRSQFHGGEIALVPPPNRWRAMTPNAPVQTPSYSKVALGSAVGRQENGK